MIADQIVQIFNVLYIFFFFSGLHNLLAEQAFARSSANSLIVNDGRGKGEGREDGADRINLINCLRRVKMWIINSGMMSEQESFGCGN